MNWVRKYSQLNGPKRSGRGRTPSSFPPLPPTYQRRAVAGEESSDLSQEKIRDLRRRATMLWVDKYRPRSLDKMLVHQDIAQNLKRLVLPRQRGICSSSFFHSVCLIVFFLFVCLLDEVSEHDDCPHLLFYGPSGSGKKTLIMAVVKQMFGAGAEKVRFFLLNLSLLIYLIFFFEFEKKILFLYC